MEDFDANIEDQKEENKKDAEEEESELVGNTSAQPHQQIYLITVPNRDSVCTKIQIPSPWLIPFPTIWEFWIYTSLF